MAPVTNKKTISPLTQLMKIEPDLISFLREGDIVEAKLLRKIPKAAYFDLGKFGTGIVYGLELINAKSIIKDFKIGDNVNSKVVLPENDEGYVELSLSGAHKQKNWQEIKDLKDSGEISAVKIITANSGGLVAELSEIKAFLPVSQLSNEHYPRVNDGDKMKILEELKKLVGMELNVKILDFNPRVNKLIISEREASEQNVKELISKYKIGDTIDGIISGTAEFGVFVRFADNPVIEGLVHISELDYRVVDNPEVMFKAGDPIRVKIIDIKDGQVSLSFRALKVNPWETATEKLKEGEGVTGTVYKFNPYGAYINLENDLQGLIHVSEFGGSLDEMKKALLIGSIYKFVIVSLKPQERRIVLQLKK